MKSVLISIQPKWCELIASGKKTVEVRKAAPKEKEPFKAYIYQTKKKWTYRLLEKLGLYQGKVVGEFVCDRIDNIFYDDRERTNPPLEEILEQSCLTYSELCEYGNYKDLYGWHISDLKIYDTPKKLGEFNGYCSKKKECYADVIRHCDDTHFSWKCNPLDHPPQSWCYVEA